MKKVLKIVWRLFPWVLMVRFAYVALGITFSKLKCDCEPITASKHLSKYELMEACKEGFQYGVCVRKIANAGWKWFLNK